MKCITCILIFNFYMWAVHALHAQASERKCQTRTYHTRVPHSPKYSFKEKRCACTKMSNQWAMVSKLQLMCKLF